MLATTIGRAPVPRGTPPGTRRFSGTTHRRGPAVYRIRRNRAKGQTHAETSPRQRRPRRLACHRRARPDRPGRRPGRRPGHDCPGRSDDPRARSNSPATGWSTRTTSRSTWPSSPPSRSSAPTSATPTARSSPRVDDLISRPTARPRASPPSSAASSASARTPCCSSSTRSSSCRTTAARSSCAPPSRPESLEGRPDYAKG